MKLTPLGDRILVIPEETPNKIGGIFIPDSSREKPHKGEVVAIGVSSHDVSPGNKVLYGKSAGTEINFEGKKYLVMRAGDCFAVIED